MCIVIGYCRVSTMKQSLQRQEENIRAAYPDTELKIFKEKYSGATMNRDEWIKAKRYAIGQAEKGKDVTIVFDECSRMGRNAKAAFEEYKELYTKGVRLCFLKEPHLNTDVFKKSCEKQIARAEDGNEIINRCIDFVNEMLMLVAEEQIKSAFEGAEWELVTKRKNIKDGVARAQAEGKQVGREKGVKVETKKCKESKQRIVELSKSFNGTLEDMDVMKLLGISRNSYYKYKGQIKDELDG